MNSSKVKIGVIGHGFVGKAVEYAFSTPGVKVVINDPKYGHRFEDLGDLSEYDALFVCVPTPMSDDGSVNTTILENVLRQCAGPSGSTTAMIVIKSTVTPDFFNGDNLMDTVYPKFYQLNLVYNPEFLTEGQAKQDIINPPFHIITHDNEYLEYLYKHHSLCNAAPFIRVSLKEAAMIKYGINTFLATKVTFFNQLAEVCEAAGARSHTVINAIGRDERIGSSHTKVPGFDGKKGFGGACFPKDTSALINAYEGFTLLEECVRINNNYRASYNLDDREKEQNISYKENSKP